MVEKIPDVVTMNMAASLLLEQRDFASFCKKGSDNKTTLCKVSKAQWDIQGELWVFRITADRFLRNMVRAIVGSLYEVGRGKWSVEEFRNRLIQKNRGAMGTSAPAQGLYLTKVTYKNL